LKRRCQNVLQTSDYVRFRKSIFLSGGKLNVSVDYDRGECQERVGENGTEIRLTV
jgi:hypothetical protein